VDSSLEKQVNSAKDATIRQTATTKHHEAHAIELQTDALEVSQEPLPPTVNRVSSGFKERYQGRFKLRFEVQGMLRGLMFVPDTLMTSQLLTFNLVHLRARRPEFRGSTLKPTESS